MAVGEFFLESLGWVNLRLDKSVAESTEMRKKEHEEGNMCHIVACCWKHLFSNRIT